jgi:hypothetical protein
MPKIGLRRTVKRTARVQPKSVPRFANPEGFSTLFPRCVAATRYEFTEAHCGKCPKLWTCFESFGASSSFFQNVSSGFTEGVFRTRACYFYQLHGTFHGYNDSAEEDFAFRSLQAEHGGIIMTPDEESGKQKW